MKKLLALISDSYHEFKHISTITTCAMFGAMSIVLNQLATIRVTPNLKIGFGALPNELVDYLFGPVVGSLFGGGMDIIKFMLKPDGGFMPGFTFNAMLAAFIYGLFLYKKPLSLKRMLAAKLVVAVLCNILLGTLWLSMINGKGYLALLPRPGREKPDPVAGGLPDLRPGSQDPGAGRRIPAGPPPASIIKQAVRSSHGHPGSARIP